MTASRSFERILFAYSHNPYFSRMRGKHLQDRHGGVPFGKIFRPIKGELRAALCAAGGELLGAHLIGPEVTKLLPELTLWPRRVCRAHRQEGISDFFRPSGSGVTTPVYDPVSSVPVAIGGFTVRLAG